MQKSILLAIPLLFTSVATGQTVNMTFPKAQFTNTEGGHRSYYIGAYRNGRQQMVYGDYQGSNTVQNIKGLQFRRSKMTPLAAGRKWTNFEIRIVNADFQKMDDRWAGNMLTTPTLVYKGAVAFPSTTGIPATSPATWGKFKVAGDMNFPFGAGGTSSSFLHLGISGTTFDFQMQGGTLDNATTWGTGFHAYYLDGTVAASAAGNVWKEASQTRTGNTTCRATGRTRYSTWQTWLFSDNTKNPAGGKQHRWEWYGYGMIKSHPHIGVFSFFPAATPITFLASCQKLDLDLSKPYNLYPYMSDSAGNNVEPFYKWPWTTGSIGLNIHTQAAFADKGLLQLTSGYFSTVPTPPTVTKSTTFAARIYRGVVSKYGFGPYDSRIAVIGVY